ncbi:LPXTG cell wall anchor domain-containing protein [Lactococcus formosensis]|uniref:LPXTG cell wall anchor domain-containing protein n=1 Tax=Lactococcus formosensis TaxID=1281486 RepID=UPI00326643D4
MFTHAKQEVKYLYTKNQAHQINLPATGEDNGKFLTTIGAILLFLIGGVIFFCKKD